MGFTFLARTYNPLANSGDHTWYKVNAEDPRIIDWLHTYLLIPERISSSWRSGGGVLAKSIQSEVFVHLTRRAWKFFTHVVSFDITWR